MTHILGPRETQASAYFCPSCGSPAVNVQSVTLHGGAMPASCDSCGWQGATTQLAVAPFKHGFANDEEIARTMSTELRNLLSKTAGQTYGRFLLKWGFMDEPVSALQLATYLDAIAKAVVRTIVQTRQQLLEEKARERTTGPRS